MVRGLFGSWKQIIFCDFDQKMTKEILLDLITRLHEIRFTVKAIVSDCGGGNQGLWKSLEVNHKKCYFSHPKTDSNIYVFADAPHLLKLIRNWLLDTGIKLGNGQIITKRPFESLINHNCGSDLSTIHISDKHLNLTSVQKQNVQTATELLSRKTAILLQRYVGDYQDCKALQEFILTVNNWFDVFNVYWFNAAKSCTLKVPYGVKIHEQDEALSKMTTLIQEMRSVGKVKLQVYQKGILMSVSDLQFHYFHIVVWS